MENKEYFSTEEIIREFNTKFNLELYGKTIENFFHLYDVEYWNYAITSNKWIPETITRSYRFRPEIKSLIFENSGLIIDFHKEFYERVYTIEEISKITQHKIDDVKKAIKIHFQDRNFQLFLVARNFTREDSAIPNDTKVCNITIKHIIKILDKKSPKLIKTLNDLDSVKSSNNVEYTNKTIFESRTIGYSDYREILEDTLIPITDPEAVALYDLEFPAGILFFGPPGCGKTFWAEEICKYLDFELIEITRSEFGSTYVEGSMLNLKEKLEDVKNKSKVVLFFDEFDSIVPVRGGEGAMATINRDIVNTLLQEIPKLIEKKILIIAASNFVSSLDTAVTRDGRFEKKIPIFPPLPIERINLLLSYLEKYSRNSKILSDILEKSNANKIEFWYEYMNELGLFPTSSIKALSKNIKTKISSFHRKNGSFKLINEFISDIIKETRSGILEKHIQDYVDFYTEITNMTIQPALEHRRDQLFKEINSYLGSTQKPSVPMGFR